MPVFISVNVNDKVRVKLTDRGRKILAAEDQEYLDWMKKKGITKDPINYNISEEGYTVMELWRVMQVFGGALYNGCDAPFETLIEVIK